MEIKRRDILNMGQEVSRGSSCISGCIAKDETMSHPMRSSRGKIVGFGPIAELQRPPWEVKRRQLKAHLD